MVKIMNYQNIEIIDETNHYLVVIKPSGILSQGDITKDDNMLDLLKKYLINKYQKKGDAYLGLIHRLDRMTSGLMVFGKTSKGSSRISEQVKNHLFKKSYIAYVEGIVTKDGEIESKLLFDEKTLKAYIDESGKYAKLKYQVLSYYNGNTFLKIDLETGRHHQIRIQMSSISHPLVGDTLYGSKTKKPILLHAYKISFLDPITKELKEYVNYPKWLERKKLNGK